MMNTYEELGRAGIVIYQDGEKWIVLETQEKNASSSFLNYESALEGAKEILVKRNSKKCRFSVIMRYDRGLGVEYINLSEVEAMSVQLAQDLANANAEVYIKTAKDMGKAVIKEVRIRPITA